ncbi:MAG: hypothetical protein M1837_003677 [Sclerophora amabilis]|nr:MAG: hypothetical protein M1837_003677 [Sclerophora amabilis]
MAHSATSLSRAPSASSNHTHSIGRRHATVYDAVAGRVSTTRFIPSEPSFKRDRDTLASSTVPVPPEEVLFRRKGAPTRYEEEDIYFANERLAEDQALPDSDLLKAIHCYASDFYSRSAVDDAIDWRSMDETALLALGILLEETVKETLGETGDLVFVEEEEQEQGNEVEVKVPGYRSRTQRSFTSDDESRQTSFRVGKGKRRKLDHESA